MPTKTSDSWWSRKFWTIVLFPLAGAVLLAGVSVFQGWLHRRAGFDAFGNPLPDGSTNTPMSAKDPPLAKPRPELSVEDAEHRILADVQRRDPEARPRLRYLTLRHRNNEPSCTAADLDMERRAVRELVILLGHGKAPNAEFIDPDQLIYRIDLQDFDWDPATEWHQIVTQYRYGLRGGGDESLAKLRQQIEEATKETVPAVRADWFVVAFTHPPLAAPDGLIHIPHKDLPDDVREVSRRYSTQTLDLAACARELDLRDAQVLERLVRGEDHLQQEFGLAPLLKGERIRREWWESDRNLFSPYQETARLLKIGKPVRVQ